MAKLIIALGLSALIALVHSGPIAFSGQKRHDHNDYTKFPKRMICYIGAWADWHVGNDFKPYEFQLEKINTEVCTHISYGFAKLDEYNYTMVPFDPFLDLGKTPEVSWAHDGYARFMKLREKNPNLTLMIALGGWFEGSEKYSDMASTAERRHNFVQNAVKFLKQYGFDGLDLDWEHPGSRMGKPVDKQNFISLITELNEAFKEEGYLLTSAVAAGQPIIERAYGPESIAKMNELLDWVNVMTYDYHGGFDHPPFLRHNAPLYNRPEENTEQLIQFTINYTVTYYLGLGMKKEKMNMGLAFYGRGFSIHTPDTHNPDDLGDGMSPEGPVSLQAGVLGFDELCVFEKKQPGWKNSYDPYWKSPFAWNSKEWIGFDNIESLICKTSYLKKMDLGGAMAWSLEFDDFNENCGAGKYPLLNTVHKYLNGEKKNVIECPYDGLDPPRKPTTAPPTTPEPTTRPTTPEPTTRPTTPEPTTRPTTPEPTTRPTTPEPTTRPTTPEPTTRPTTPEPTTRPTTPEPTTRPTTPEPTTRKPTTPTPEPTPEPTEEPKVTTITPGGDVIRCYEEGRIPHPTDPHKYVVCEHIVTSSNDGWVIHIMGCGAGTKWKQTKKYDGECVDDTFFSLIN